MNIDREEKKKEARSRMVILKLHPEAIREFWEEDSPVLSFGGILSGLSDAQKERVRQLKHSLLQ